MKHIWLFVFSVLLVFTACKKENLAHDPQKVLDAFGQHTGTWELKPNTNTYMEWNKQDDIYIGTDYSVNEPDTIMTKVFFLEQIGDSVLFQIQAITDTGISFPIEYHLTKATNNRFEFENPNQNFPKKMIYSFSGNELNLYLEGQIEDSYQQTDLRYTKVK